MRITGKARRSGFRVAGCAWAAVHRCALDRHAQPPAQLRPLLAAMHRLRRQAAVLTAAGRLAAGGRWACWRPDPGWPGAGQRQA